MEQEIEFPAAQLPRSGIYAILNFVNNKIYVGSAVNLYQRWRDHKSNLKINKHHSILLQRSYNKYGLNSFIFVVLEYINDVKIIYDREHYWITELNACDLKFGYNILKAANTRLGLKSSEIHRNKISKALTGLIRSEETKAKMSAAKKGHLVSEEARLKIGLAGLGRKPPNRNTLKWPCPDARKCKCENCFEKRREEKRIWNLKKRHGIIIICP